MIGRQNWSDECVSALNKQINNELNASFTYHLISCYFRRLDVGLEKLAEYFNKASLEERTHANQLMDYQTMRGGTVTNLTNITSIVEDLELFTTNDIIKSLEIALEMEKSINLSLLKLHKIAENNNDAQFSDYLEGNYLNEQVEAIAELSKVISVLKSFGDNRYGIVDYVNDNL